MSQKAPLNITPGNLNFTKYDFLKADTPCYIYDSKWLKDRFRYFKNLFPDYVKIFYSIKANPNVSILKILNSVGSYFEVASLGEMSKAISAGIQTKHIIYIAPGKKDDDIENAIKSDIYAIVVDSANEVKKIIERAQHLNKRQNIMFRVNPGKKSSGILSMSGSTKFGMEVNQVIESWKDLLKFSNLVKCIGLQCFQGSNIVQTNLLISEFLCVAESFKEILNKTGEVPKILDFGGGFPFSPLEGDNNFDAKYFKMEIGKFLSKIKAQFSNTIFAFESGRFLVAGCGTFLTKVIDIKELFGKKYIIMDGGTNFYIPNNYGFRAPAIQIIGNGGDKELVDLCGPLCTPLDSIARNIELPKISIDDIVVIYNAGAYQYSLSPINFLSFKAPLEKII